jgi:DNA-binding transcriptional ArsR family regulator
MVDEHSEKPRAVGDVVGMLRTLSDPTRLRLLTVLQEGELSVSALCDRLHLAQPTVSHHLGRLRTARLVANRRAGKQVFYSLNDELVSHPGEEQALAIATGPLELRIVGAEFNGSANGDVEET